MRRDPAAYLLDMLIAARDTAEFAYAAGQQLARALLDAGSNGIAYDSVRWTGGECVAEFRPRLLPNARQQRHLCYVWDGNRIVTVYEKRQLDAGN